jgi:hypothetical protein
MTTEVNLMAMLRHVKHTHDDEAKHQQQVATFKEEQDETAKRFTKEPPKLVMARIRLPGE